jgi:hypothetical protein
VAHRILGWLVDFWIICGSLFHRYQICNKTGKEVKRNEVYNVSGKCRKNNSKIVPDLENAAVLRYSKMMVINESD